MAKPILTSRRNFMAGTSSFIALSALPGYLTANQLSALKSQFNDQQGIVVFKEGDKHSAEFAAVFADTGMTVVELGLDPVRQWRDGLSELVTDQQRPIIGMTNWSDYLIMRGLAAEIRRFPVLEVQHKISQEDKIWASSHALELLELSQTQSLEDVQQILTNTKSSNTLNGKSLFSWLIT